MPHGLIYQGEFSSKADDYRLEILKKDYTGPFTTLPMAGVPIVQNWGTDEVKDAIKGCSLAINYLNFGSNPIDNFYSNNDDEFLVRFYQDAQLLFSGYLVQDDIREPLIDTTHEVQLSANDGLGLLKDIAFDKTAPAWYLAPTAQGDFISVTTPVQNWIYLRNANFIPVVGTPFTISGHPVALMNGTFTPTVVTVLSPGNYNVRTNTFTGDTAAEPVYLNGSGGAFDFYGRNTIMNAIAICLQNTGVEIETNVYCNIFEDYHNPAQCPLSQTLIDYQTFIAGDVFDNCFNVLNKICDRFNITIFQALGKWNIIRWDELKRSPDINGFVFDINFAPAGTTTLDADMIFGFGEDIFPVTGITKSIVRPFEYTKEAFNYQQPKYLLQNYDLLQLGALLRTYMSGTTRVSEYIAIAWLGIYGNPAVERFIRVEYDTVLERESDRYLVLRGPTYDSIRCLPAKNIDCNVGDKISFACTFRTNISGIPGAVSFAISLTDGVSTRYLKNTGATAGGNGTLSWSSTFGFTFVYPAGENSNQWHSMDTALTPPLPYTGVMNIFLPQFTDPPQNATRESHFKDMRFEYITYINDSTKIIGHIHKDLQVANIKNNEANDIYMDDAPRNSIQGVLFRNRLVGLVQDRTTLWYKDPAVPVKRKLGEITTEEQLQWRSMPRSRLDGTFVGLIQSGKYVSMLNHFTYAQLPGLNFLFGTLQIDYRNNRFNCSATELFKNTDVDVNGDYSFTYIYDTK